MLERDKHFHSQIERAETKTLSDLRDKKIYNEIEGKELETARKAFVEVRKFYSSFGIDTAHIPDPKLYWADDDYQDAAYYDFENHSVKIKKGDFSFRLVAHEFAHSLGIYKEFYGGNEKDKYDIHLRVGFRQRKIGGKDFYKNVDEGMKELVARTVASIAKENSQSDSYDFEVKTLIQIINCIDSTNPQKKGFQMFLESDVSGWTKELKDKLLECFGSEALKVLNFNYFLLENLSLQNRIIYVKHLIGLFSKETLLMSPEQKTEKGKRVLDFIKRHEEILEDQKKNK